MAAQIVAAQERAIIAEENSDAAMMAAQASAAAAQRAASERDTAETLVRGLRIDLLKEQTARHAAEARVLELESELRAMRTQRDEQAERRRARKHQDHRHHHHHHQHVEGDEVAPILPAQTSHGRIPVAEHVAAPVRVTPRQQPTSPRHIAAYSAESSHRAVSRLARASQRWDEPTLDDETGSRALGGMFM
jgi:hypothetical protein